MSSFAQDGQPTQRNASLRGPVFISYETDDGLEAALWISGQFSGCTPPVPCWVAELSFEDPEAVIDSVTDAIQASSCFVLVVTPHSIITDSGAANQWKQAFKYKKPIILAMMEDCEVPGRLARRPQTKVTMLICTQN